MQTEKIIWESRALFAVGKGVYYYRILLRKSKKITTNISSVDIEVCYQETETGIKGSWQPIEKFSMKYGEVLQLALLEMM